MRHMFAYLVHFGQGNMIAAAEHCLASISASDVALAQPEIALVNEWCISHSGSGLLALKGQAGGQKALQDVLVAVAAHQASLPSGHSAVELAARRQACAP